MKHFLIKYIPILIGVTVGVFLYYAIGWWGFLLIFPWIGVSVAIGIHLHQTLKGKQKLLGRKISILLILPVLLLFVPLVNHENFQLEGVVLLVMVGYFSKGFIHFAVAKLFGPLIWGRGFCGWACWTAAVLDWLPIKKQQKSTIPEKLKYLRYVLLTISLLIPLFAIYIFNYNVKESYINKSELTWMIISNIVYYSLAVPLAFYFSDNRAFCKILCPVSIVMKVPSQFSLIKRQPTGNECIQCGNCNNNCPMNVDVMFYIYNQKKVTDTECIVCGNCKLVCPVNAIK
jgi:polyferredoxin